MRRGYRAPGPRRARGRARQEPSRVRNRRRPSSAWCRSGSGTCSSDVCSSDLSPGPKFTAGVPRAEKRETSVQPCLAATGTSPPRAARNCRAGAVSSPGRAPAPASVTSISRSRPDSTSRTWASAWAMEVSGAKRQLSVTRARSGITFPAMPPELATAVSPSRDSRRASTARRARYEADPADTGLGLGEGGVRRETVGERHPCPGGDHVAGDAARDGDSVEALAVLESVDHGAAGPVGGEPLEDRGQVVDGVVADPVTAGVGGDPAGGDVELHGALAASLDPGGGRFPQDREVADQVLGMLDRTSVVEG